jgi:uncharacterized protein YbaR (Trm112 family)
MNKNKNLSETEKQKRLFVKAFIQDGELYCPNDDAKLEFDQHQVGMMDRYRIGNEWDVYICPKCKQEFAHTTIFRD